jgi:hypothetical protein
LAKSTSYEVHFAVFSYVPSLHLSSVHIFSSAPLFSNTLSLCYSHNVRHRVLYPYRTTDNIVFVLKGFKSILHYNNSSFQLFTFITYVFIHPLISDSTLLSYAVSGCITTHFCYLYLGFQFRCPHSSVRTVQFPNCLPVAGVSNAAISLCSAKTWVALYSNRSFTVSARGASNLIICAFQNSSHLFIDFLRMGIKFLFEFQ